MRARFEVSTEGMRELQAGREPWQLAKELVSNAWDEKATVCTVRLESNNGRTVRLSVYDDGPGFSDITDAWTLMGHTLKRGNPEVRGRFNIGEKEVLSVASEARITTSGKVIIFPKTGGRQVKTDRKALKGTLIEATLPWGRNQARVAAERLQQMLPPKGITYTVNGVVVPHASPYKTTQAVLETVVQSSPGAPLMSSRRRTPVEILKTAGIKGTLYEMGIPVQTLECPYSVNVLQKIPLPPNRDTVRDSYLQDVYALVLNVTADEVEDAAASWVRTAIEDKEVAPEAVKAVAKKRYGDKAVLWSADTQCNDKALEAGYEVVHGRTLSTREREVFASVGIRHSSEVFPSGNRPMTYLPDEKLTDGMKRVRQYAVQLFKALYKRDLEVRFYSEFGYRTAADFGADCLGFNIACLGKDWFDDIDARVTSLLLHEFAHTRGIGHEPGYYRSLEELAGRAVHLALEDPKVFEVKEGKNA